MAQSRRSSFIEQVLNVVSGFAISLLVWEYYVVGMFSIEVDSGDNVIITAIFTVVSLVRGYLWRRLFNSSSKLEEL